MRILLALVSLSFALPALAQEPVVPATRFSGIRVGNAWDYSTSGRSSPTGPPVFLYREFVYTTADSLVVIDGEPYVVLTTRRSPSANGPTFQVTTCAFSEARGTAAAAPLPGYDCSQTYVLPPPLPWTGGPTTVTPSATVVIRERPAVVDSLLQFGSQQNGPSGAYTATLYRYATDIGLLLSRTWGQGPATSQGQALFDDSVTLERALIDGVTYGGYTVASEPAQTERPAFRLTAAPNPFAAAVAVTPTAASDLVVFDALGRAVARGTAAAGQAFRFSVPAAGVYTVRATDAAGHTATTRVVRR